MPGTLRSTVLLSVIALAVSGFLAGPASADASITISSGGAGGVWGSNYVPTLNYGNPLQVRAGSSTDEVVSLTTSGACTVTITTPGPPTVANITANAASGTCTVSASVTGGTLSYDLPMASGDQTAKLGGAFNPNITASQGKRYLLGTKKLTTDQGNPVSFTVKGTPTKACTIVTKKGKVYVQMAKKSANKSCTVTATAQTTSAEINPYYVQNVIGIFK